MPAYQEAVATSSASSYSHDTGIDKNVFDESSASRPTTANPFHRRNYSFSHTLPWRRRPKSLLFADVDTPTNELVIEDADADTHQYFNADDVHEGDAPKHGGSIKGRLRRASLSLMKNIVGASHATCSTASTGPATNTTISHANEPEDDHPVRPSTSHSTWQRLRKATSFRHTRSSHGRRALDTIYSPLESTFPDIPVPGSGLAPPIIPHHTGAAAKASAAMQNEYLAFARHRQEWLSGGDSQNDCESGIGIAVTTASELEKEAVEARDTVVRTDFISQLPVELAVQILSYLDASQLSAASRVSKLWYAIVQDQHIWRQSFLREKTDAYATSMPVQPGTGCGIPAIRPGNDWQKIYRAREELDKRWKIGKRARAVYLNGHLDSIYCLQFDEYVPTDVRSAFICVRANKMHQEQNHHRISG
jgi:hypothetical protein